jgi:dihydrofolate reductase
MDQSSSPLITLIVAAGEDDAIGRDNDLIWKLPQDMRFFKNTTWGMPVAMGRKTFESMGARPLPGRFNIVISRQPNTTDDRLPDLRFVASLEAAIAWARETNCRELFIAGGAEIYALAMPLADRILLTRVHARFPDADAHFRGFDPEVWSLTSAQPYQQDDKHAFDFTIQRWDRKRAETADQ